MLTRVDYLKHLKTEERRLRAVGQHGSARLPKFDAVLNVGLRRGSHYALTWDMVDWTGRMLNIPRTWTKGKSLSTFP